MSNYRNDPSFPGNHHDQGQVPPPPARKPKKLRKGLLITAGVAVGVLTLSGVANSGSESAPPALPTVPPPTATAPADPTQVPAPAPVPATEAPAPAKETQTASQRQAVKKAKSYLEYSAFSRVGLVKQLEFEGFSSADAKYAVDHIEVDWNEQAAKKAKSYLEYSAFSRPSLIAQLEFDGFTPAQAEYGADAAGL